MEPLTLAMTNKNNKKLPSLDNEKVHLRLIGETFHMVQHLNYLPIVEK